MPIAIPSPQFEGGMPVLISELVEKQSLLCCRLLELS